MASLKRVFHSRMRYLFPNLLTAGNLGLGIMALLASGQGALTQAGSWVLACVLLDALDGRVARNLNAVSRFGIYFDSCADWVSFGTVPAVAFWIRHHRTHEGALFIGCIYLACATFRLIRFHRHRRSISPIHLPLQGFVGLPTTASGGLYAVLALWIGPLPLWTDLCLILGLALAMVLPWHCPNLETILAFAFKGNVAANLSTLSPSYSDRAGTATEPPLKSKPLPPAL
jgi:CDP-diacylglycerol--serine O-phosphatidyltransferase